MSEATDKPAPPVETTAEWVEQAMVDVFESYSEAERDKTMPLILLLMAKEFGFDELQPKIKNAVQVVMIAAGLRENTTEEEAAELMAAYTKRLQPNEDMLRDIRKVFDRHYEVLGESNAKNFGRMAGIEPDKSAPMVGDKKPDGALSIDQLKFPKRL